MQLDQSQVESIIMRVLTTIVEEWGDEVDQISFDSLLVEDVGFASIDFVQFAVAIEKEFAQKLGFQALLMQDGAYVEDLSVKQVSDFVWTQLSGTEEKAVEVSSGAKQILQIDDADKVCEEKLAHFRSIIKPCIPRQENKAEKNPPAVFLLSPPRSGSTLLRVMLAGSPQLFVPPELHLLSYNDMAQRKQALDDEHNHHLLEGTIRGMMQLRGWDSEQARTFAAGCEERALSCKQFYKLMQSTMGQRLLVDKTPTYAINPDILSRAEEDFEGAKYIHLTRHPCGTIRSYEESKLARLMPLLNASEYSSRELGEMTWLTCHQNILDFSKRVPKERFLSVSYESLVAEPEQELKKICEFLGIELHPDMLNPYEDNEKRMADGVDVASKMSGDLKFHLHQGIDASAAYRWQQFYSEDMLGNVTKETARRCGYSL